MKTVMITLATMEIGYGFYSIAQGEPFADQLTLFIMGVLLLACADLNYKTN